MGLRCPDDEELARYVDGDIEAALQKHITEHLEQCDACEELIGALARDLDEAQHTQTIPQTRISRFVVLRPIAAGATSVVYKAYDPKLDRNVALKILRTEVSADDDQVRGFLLREAQAIARVRHPSVISVYDIGEFEKRIFIAMEYVPSVTLTQWLKNNKPPWPKTLALFKRAAEGLAAAHAAGLVHRDFKPDNVLVDHEGHPKVIDFGLARVRAMEPADPTERPLLDIQAASSSLSSGLVGTPAYMSPEQMLSKRVDARSDLYSFCVALFEALYGVRPFGGNTLEEVKENALQNRLEAPRLRRPPWLRSALQKGLQSDPNDRPPSMEALLQTLDGSRRRRRNLIGASAAALGLGALVAGGFWRIQSTSCQGKGAQIREVWSPARARSIRTAFQGTSSAYAQEAFEMTQRALDRYASAWRRSRVALCEAPRSDRRSPRHQTQQRCLQTRLQELDALAKLLGEANVSLVLRSPDAALSLSSVSSCFSDAERSEQRALPKEQVRLLQPLLAQARASLSAGRYSSAQKTAEALASKTEALGASWLHSEALWLVGVAQAEQTHFKEAHRTLQEVAWLAHSISNEHTAQRALARLIRLSGYRLEDAEEAELWWRWSQALLERDRPSPSAQAALWGSRAIVQRKKGDYKNAVRSFEQALSVLEGEDTARASLQAAQTMVELGHTQLRQGEPRAAMEVLKTAVLVRRDLLGAQHPSVAIARRYWGMALRRAGHPERGFKEMKAAEDIQRQVLGEKHLEFAYTLNIIGNAHYALGRYAQAHRYYLEASQIGEAALGADHFEVQMAKSNLALSLLRLKRYDEAEPLLRSALSFATTKLGDHPYIGFILTVLGDLSYGQKKYPEALAYYRRSLPLQEKAFGATHPDLVLSLTGIGRVLRHQGQFNEARKALERALQICGAKDVEPMEHIQALTELAELLASQNEPPDRVQGLRKTILQLYEKLGLEPPSNVRAEQR